MKSNPSRIDLLIQRISFILVFFIFTRTPWDADLWWHLRAGKVMWEQHKILLTDPFSYTRFGATWTNAFWVSEMLLYQLNRVGGYFTLSIFVSFIGAMTFYFIYRRLPGNTFLNTLVIILAAITAAPIWGPRPQIISFFFIALLDYLLITRKNKWFIISLFALWSNIHGGWIWGFLLLMAQIAGLTTKLAFAGKDERDLLWKDIKGLIGCTAISAVAIAFNPNGPAIWRLPFQQINVSMQIQEWLSPDFHRVDFHPFLWMIFLLLLASPFQTKPPDWSRIFKVLGFAYLTFVAQRNIALFAIVTAPLLADWMNAALASLMKDKRTINRKPDISPKFTRVFNSLIIIIMGFTAMGYSFLVSRPTEIDKNYPVNAVQWIQKNKPPGRLFNSYNWGGYLLWNLQQYPVFIDGRADLYGDEIISQWQSVVSAQDNALSILDQWDVNIVLIETNSPIIKLLKSDQWETAFQDEVAVVLIRKQ